jgi:hypothetical protein
MKPLSFIWLMIILLIFSCRKPENSPAPSSVISGKNWKLVEYNYNGTDITNNFSDCRFSFGSDGVLKISNAGQTFTGTWKEFSNPPKLEITIVTNNTFVQLFNKNWENKLLNPQRIELADSKIDPQEIIKLDLIP